MPGMAPPGACGVGYEGVGPAVLEPPVIEEFTPIDEPPTAASMLPRITALALVGASLQATLTARRSSAVPHSLASMARLTAASSTVTPQDTGSAADLDEADTRAVLKGG